MEDLTLKVCNKPLEVDYLINIPVLKPLPDQVDVCFKKLKAVYRMKKDVFIH